jgi:hypothetical protein
MESLSISRKSDSASKVPSSKFSARLFCTQYILFMILPWTTRLTLKQGT